MDEEGYSCWSLSQRICEKLKLELTCMFKNLHNPVVSAFNYSFVAEGISGLTGWRALERRPAGGQLIIMVITIYTQWQGMQQLLFSYSDVLQSRPGKTTWANA